MIQGFVKIKGKYYKHYGYDEGYYLVESNIYATHTFNSRNYPECSSLKSLEDKYGIKLEESEYCWMEVGMFKNIIPNCKLIKSFYGVK